MKNLITLLFCCLFFTPGYAQKVLMSKVEDGYTVTAVEQGNDITFTSKALKKGSDNYKIAVPSANFPTAQRSNGLGHFIRCLSIAGNSAAKYCSSHPSECNTDAKRKAVFQDYLDSCNGKITHGPVVIY